MILPSAVEAGHLCEVVGSPLQERYRLAGVSPLQGCKDD